MGKEARYIDYFYNKHPGRLAISVGYNQDMSEIYPFVFSTVKGRSIGIVALGVLQNGKNVVHIYHLGAFVPGTGEGSQILRELCVQADFFNVLLSVSAVSMSYGNDEEEDKERLEGWYKGFGFAGEGRLLRQPHCDTV